MVRHSAAFARRGALSSAHARELKRPAQQSLIGGSSPSRGLLTPSLNGM